MSAKTYWKLLVLFGVLCQGIIGKIAEMDIDESSELLVRQKRVINRAAKGGSRQPIRDAAYVVSIKEYRRDDSCVGSILSNHIVITAAKCVVFDLKKGRVYSGSAGKPTKHRNGHFVLHKITDKKEKLIPHPNRTIHGIALISVNPPFIYSVNTHNIQLSEGHNQHGLNGTVSGWGCDNMGHIGTPDPGFLQSITVPIITNRDCAQRYVNISWILDSDMCIFDPTGNQHCGVHDIGAPLVITSSNNVMTLTGIHLWNGAVGGRAIPDVFANVQHPAYRDWIAEASRNLTRTITYNSNNQFNLIHPQN